MIQSVSSSWNLLLELFEEMDQQSINPSDIAGSNPEGENPIEDILKQLTHGNPDWKQISQDLTKLHNLCSDMIAIVTAPGFKMPVSDPDFLKDCQATLQLIDKLQQDVAQKNTGKFETDFYWLMGALSVLKQGILQG
jgi:hypothetical protein